MRISESRGGVRISACFEGGGGAVVRSSGCVLFVFGSHCCLPTCKSAIDKAFWRAAVRKTCEGTLREKCRQAARYSLKN